ESIDNAFARFNTIITSLKALDEGFSSKNYVRKFLKALHSKWHVKVTAIEESKDWTSLSLDELIGNLKVYEAKKESSNDDSSTSENERKSLQRSRDDKNSKSERKCFRCGDSNHLIEECPKSSRNNIQRAFIGGAWSDSGEDEEEKNKDKTCLVAQASNKICLEINLEPDEWIKNSGCSKHMTGNRKLFSTYQAYNGGNVIIGSNLRSNIIGKVKESLNVTFDETPPPPKTLPLEDDDLVEEEAIEVNKTKPLGNDLEDKSLENNEIINIKESKSHPLDNVIGNLNQRTLRSQAQDKNFRLFQMDVKSAFLNGFINEEVYVAQPQGFIDFAKPNHVYRLKKALYGLKQAPKACFIRLFGITVALIKVSAAQEERKDIEGESVDNTKYRGIIGSSLYLTVSRPDIMFSVCLCARFQEDPKISHLEAVKRIFRYVKGTMHLGLWYPKGSGIETIVYVDSDHAGDYVDRKSTTSICTFMGCCLTSWFSKKQTALAISTTKAEYVRAGKACQQALWIKQALIDYGIRLDDIPIMCENKGAIDLSKNLV
ncbi:retrovirus-related pol polyprotein from transposon TNT 1-94, partial [Tanacetum coccineum]